MNYYTLYKEEWSNTFEYAPSNNGTLNYFFGSDWDTNSGQFYTNNSHRGRSAFLRVLQFAHFYWGMPINYAEQLAILALPIEPVFKLIKPQPSSWMPIWKYKSFNKRNLTTFIKKCLTNLEAQYPGRLLGALSFPLEIASNKWLDITITRCLNLNSNLIESKDFNNNCYSIAEKLEPILKFYVDIDKLETYQSLKPLAGTGYSLTRFGYWHSDMERRGIAIPLVKLKHKYIEVKNEGVQHLKFDLDGESIGLFGFWYYEWSPTYPRPIKSRCGTYTLLNQQSLDTWSPTKDKECPQMLICSVELISRENSYGKYVTEEHLLQIPIE